MKTIFSILDKRSPLLIWFLSLLMMLAIFSCEIAVGNIISFEPFSFLPIMLVSWYGSKKAGFLLAILSTVAWVIFSKTTNLYGQDIASYIFNAIAHLAAYSLLAIMMTNFRNVHRVEVVAADMDKLTGIFSLRGFHAVFAKELIRSDRYQRAFSLAYIDVDNFKYINDSLGHSTGDKLLVEVAKCLDSSLRSTDTVARLGGDEFACLLPETDSKMAKKAFSKVRDNLSKRMGAHKWPVTFSVGLVTFETPPDGIKEAIKIADDLMYFVKKDKKNNIAFKVWPGNA